MLVTHVQLFVTPWTVAHHAPLSMEFSRQEYWSGLPLPSPGDLPNPGIELGSPTLQADSLPTELQIVAVTILNAGSLQLKTDGNSDFKEFIFSRKGQINK